jgi:DNA-damage-inducible protein J
MASSPVTNIRIDPDLKEQANAVFEELGLTLSTAVNVFLRAAVREGGMPFDMKLARTGDSAMEANRDITIMAEDLRHNRRNSCRRSAASYG